jgi:hypothetical protein
MADKIKLAFRQSKIVLKFTLIIDGVSLLFFQTSLHAHSCKQWRGERRLISAIV